MVTLEIFLVLHIGEYEGVVVGRFYYSDGDVTQEQVHFCNRLHACRHPRPNRPISHCLNHCKDSLISQT